MELKNGLYWVKYFDEWVIAHYFEDVKAFVKYNGAYRMNPKEITIGKRIEQPAA